MNSAEESQPPLSEPVLFILLSLAEGPSHGYALTKDVERMSDGRVRLRTGTLYGALSRLLEEDLIAAVQLKDTSRDKQSYRLTRLGRKRLASEVGRLRKIVNVAAAQLRTRAV